MYIHCLFLFHLTLLGEFGPGADVVGCYHPPTPGCVPIATTGHRKVGGGVTSLVYAEIKTMHDILLCSRSCWRNDNFTKHGTHFVLLNAKTDRMSKLKKIYILFIPQKVETVRNFQEMITISKTVTV